MAVAAKMRCRIPKHGIPFGFKTENCAESTTLILLSCIIIPLQRTNNRIPFSFVQSVGRVQVITKYLVTIRLPHTKRFLMAGVMSMHILLLLLLFGMTPTFREYNVYKSIYAVLRNLLLYSTSSSDSDSGHQGPFCLIERRLPLGLNVGLKWPPSKPAVFLFQGNLIVIVLRHKGLGERH